VRAVVVAVDVTRDRSAGVVEGLVLVQPHLPFFQFPEPAFDECLRLGVAVAAAAVADAAAEQPLPGSSAGEGRAIVGAERQPRLRVLVAGVDDMDLVGDEAARSDRGLEDGDRLLGLAARARATSRRSRACSSR
jgi:hypothetical protein